MREKRQHYRVLRKPPELEISFQNAPETEVEIVDVSIGGVGLRIAEADDPDWGADSPIKLSFRGTGLNRPLTLDATVRYRRQEGDRKTTATRACRCVQIQITPTDKSSGGSRTSNRRGQYSCGS